MSRYPFKNKVGEWTSLVSECVFSFQGYSIENTRLVVRYPDRRTQKVLPIPLKTSLPVTQQAGVAAG